MNHLRKYLNAILVVLFAVGILGLQMMAFQGVFLMLIPGFLGLSLILLLIQHPHWSAKFILWCLGIIVFSIGIEWIGVETGLLFGNFHYGSSLGWKIAGVPYLIGFYWLLLAYCCKDIADRIFEHPVAAVVMAALLMVFMDIFIEPVAIKLDFWVWPGNQVPLHNYLGWFGTSVLLFSLSLPLKLRWQNRSSVILYLCLLIFFASLNFYPSV